MEYKGYTINIVRDEYPESPREWDNLGTMICFHREYDLGDEHDLDIEEAQKLLNGKDVISLPIYIYEHSGITINTTGFSCPWDSWQLGFIYVTKEKIRQEYGWKKITKERYNKILEYLDGEVKTYDQYLTGDVYGFQIEKPCTSCGSGEQVDSCYGYYGEEDCLNEAKSVIDYMVDKEMVAA
jgi:hypothetical protein